MSELDRILDDAVAEGRATTRDVNTVRTYAQFLSETPEGVPQSFLTSADAVLKAFPDRAAFEAWRTRWLPYLTGYADGPTTPEEYAALLLEMEGRLE